MSYPTEIEGLLAQAEAEAEAAGTSGIRSSQRSVQRMLELRPVLAQLSEADRPSTVCCHCSAALSMLTPEGKPQIYCSRMHVLVWEASGEQTPLIDCDGLYLSQAED